VKLIPVLVLITEEQLRSLQARVARYQQECPADLYERMEEFKTAHSWTDEALVGGLLLGAALEPQS